MATIDKTTAAERMIVNAIAMSDRGDDPLAIHVVAASALNLMRDLIDKSGDPYVARLMKQGIFITATSRMKGLPSTLPTNAAVDALLDKVIGGIEAGEIGGPDDLILTASPAELRDMLNYVVRPYNFLKHADRDPLATLDEDDFDPDGVIVHALTAHSMACPGKEWPEQISAFLARHDLR